jgi:DNA adenine methylase
LGKEGGGLGKKEISMRTSSSKNGLAKPFVKWAGGKSQILDQIRAKYPAELGKSVTKYAEPFVGGGAVLFDVLNSHKLDAVYISDINRELIHTYTCIRDNHAELIDILDNYEREYLPANEPERKKIFYDNRDRFNDLKTQSSDDTELAALFIFLNRTCFNGLYRVNSKGMYNVPQGKYKKPTICDKKNITLIADKLQGVVIVCGDYTESQKFIDSKTFAYFDPPYRPLSTTANFTSYAQDGFDDAAQTELAKFIDEMNEKSACIVASNSDPKNTDKNDDFFDELYSKHKINRISASRMINSMADGRGKISELLIANF